METVGLIGVGKIGLPIAENLIKSGYRVLGYRRSSLDEFEQIGGIAARSPADVGGRARRDAADLLELVERAAPIAEHPVPAFDQVFGDRQTDLSHPDQTDRLHAASLTRAA